MITPNDINWSSYGSTEGPFFRGVIPYAPAASCPDFYDKALQVVTAVEGGHYDSLNMYDSCIVTLGISQQCLAIHQLERMLGACATADSDGFNQCIAQLPVPVTFSQNAAGQWRFFMADGTEVDSRQQMQTVFLCGATGQKGQWTQAQKDGAKLTASVFASMWDNPTLAKAQSDFSKANVINYTMARARQTLFADPDTTGYKGALKAAVMSFSLNVPLTADKMLAEAVANPAWATASDVDKFELAMRACVLGSGIAIWPIRYRAIQPILQTLFGVQLPTVDDLSTGHSPPPPPPTDDGLGTVKGIQQFLLSQGYDLGPWKDDGVFGAKTKAAVTGFQAKVGLPPTGIVDMATHAAMHKIKLP